MLNEEGNGGQYGFFVHPGESVTLPFKYQEFSSACNYAKSIALPEGVKVVDIEKKNIKVHFIYSFSLIKSNHYVFTNNKHIMYI